MVKAENKDSKRGTEDCKNATQHASIVKHEMNNSEGPRKLQKNTKLVDKMKVKS